MKKTSRTKRKGIIALKVVAAVILIAAGTIFVLDELTEKDGAWRPDYQKLDLTEIVKKETLSEAEYQTIFLQTGLGKSAAEEIFSTTPYEQREDVFTGFQDDFFASGDYECRQIGILTFEEKRRDWQGDPVKSFQIPSLKNGDILISKSTHSIGWRHGHAAIVTDASKGETLEAILWGYPSIYQNISKWETYSSFILLRLEEDTGGMAAEIAEYAKGNLYDLPYGLFTGIPRKAPDTIGKTQCSHLVWYPYFRYGYDLDSDGSWLVTPKDIANSDSLEIVQVFGVNPEEIWP